MQRADHSSRGFIPCVCVCVCANKCAKNILYTYSEYVERGHNKEKEMVPSSKCIFKRHRYTN